MCCEHPQRFNELFPDFELSNHTVRQIEKSAFWIRDNVRYDYSEKVRFWDTRFDDLEKRGSDDFIFRSIQKLQVWPFPPVVIEYHFARSLGAGESIGRPYYLIEGTHRVSYLLRALDLGWLPGDKLLPLLEVAPNKTL